MNFEQQQMHDRMREHAKQELEQLYSESTREVVARFQADDDIDKPKRFVEWLDDRAEKDKFEAFGFSSYVAGELAALPPKVLVPLFGRLTELMHRRRRRRA